MHANWLQMYPAIVYTCRVEAERDRKKKHTHSMINRFNILNMNHERISALVFFYE